MKKVAITAALSVVLLAGLSLPAPCAGYDSLNVGLSFFDKGQTDNAIAWLDKAIAAGDLIPDLLRIAYLDRGMSYAAKGNARQAVADYTAAITAKPDDMLAYRQRIAAYMAAGEFEKALGDYEELRKLRPHDYDILMNSGWLDWQLGHIEASADAFTYFAPIDTDAWLWLQLANVRLGRSMTDFQETANTGFWPGHLPRFFRGHVSEAEVLQAAQSSGDSQAACKANIFLGLWHAVHNDQIAATSLLQTATQKCGQGSIYLRLAKSELDKREETAK